MIGSPEITLRDVGGSRAVHGAVTSTRRARRLDGSLMPPRIPEGGGNSPLQRTEAIVRVATTDRAGPAVWVRSVASIRLGCRGGALATQGRSTPSHHGRRRCRGQCVRRGYRPEPAGSAALFRPESLELAHWAALFRPSACPLGSPAVPCYVHYFLRRVFPDHVVRARCHSISDPRDVGHFAARNLGPRPAAEGLAAGAATAGSAAAAALAGHRAHRRPPDHPGGIRRGCHALLRAASRAAHPPGVMRMEEAVAAEGAGSDQGS